MEKEVEITVTQRRSLIGAEQRVIRTLKSLGLGKIGREQKVRFIPSSPRGLSIMGMLKRVNHLVSIKH
jgi:ribosomal protein L30